MELVVVSDFDGTLTDMQRGAETYIAAYYDKLSSALGLPGAELAGLMAQVEQEMVANPAHYGWEYQGLVVAPANADPYVLNRAAAKKVIELLRADTQKYVLPREEEVDDLLTALFQACYPYAGTFFREGAQHFLQELNKLGKLFIVTNGVADVVKGKLRMLLPNNDIPVLGNAKKQLVDQTWTEVPATIQPRGFPRPVYLRRKSYHDTLLSIGQPIDIVIGDVFELDLALPEAEGMRTVLIKSPSTASWEWAYYDAHPSGLRSLTLEDAIERIATSMS